ncbi:hypothetical protein ICW40_12430 [Actinotalea ferrariae]|uniref:hypothetical protein n=1 Tax=Actinotalea ferrariae TaxID=1386098 RepID=UPI001C8C7009|nr:hypothetical protein [Actinotalea ferrariae]MBX9245608.1 hypothetical protein [Actinotalea ferrariae]
MRITLDIDLDKVPEPKGEEVGRILRYWGGAAKQLDLATEAEMPLMDSAYQQVGTLRIG